MKGSGAIVALVAVGFILACGMLAYIFFIRPQTPTINTATGSSAAIPTITVKDFAPGMPISQKTTIIIMSNDSSEEKYIVPKAQVATYIKQLPPGFHVVSQSSNN